MKKIIASITTSIMLVQLAFSAQSITQIDFCKALLSHGLWHSQSGHDKYAKASFINDKGKLLVTLSLKNIDSSEHYKDIAAKCTMLKSHHNEARVTLWDDQPLDGKYVSGVGKIYKSHDKLLLQLTFRVDNDPMVDKYPIIFSKFYTFQLA
ncbi:MULTISPECIES: hypothetical protein [Cysteiniphilum]|uniref:hypothetical protein n=1 Tax=Cysteiniphilum TaxID=2056696 RepID=UPI0017852686|nr:MULTISPECIES: hypothetical protein [Cysteiniphilum]